MVLVGREKGRKKSGCIRLVSGEDMQEAGSRKQEAVGGGGDVSFQLLLSCSFFLDGMR